ncbi:MAG: hypothetical protein LBM08_15080 [Dysgonamonadaceae bacterium]|jgi:hypothetical protein|nr:hypothetical protein [Dysgonamonadaceae bacterium]
MKKLLLAVLTLLATGYGSANAQAVWGGRIGLSRPTVSTSEGFNIAGQFGLELGPVLYYHLIDDFYLNPRAMFSLKTFKVDAKFQHTISLDIPLYAGYSFPVGRIWLYTQAGPFAGFNLAAIGFKGAGTFTSFGKVNAGLGAVAGIDLHRLRMELGYQAGLVNVADGGNAPVRLGSLFVGASYIF